MNHRVAEQFPLPLEFNPFEIRGKAFGANGSRRQKQGSTFAAFGGHKLSFSYKLVEAFYSEGKSL